MDYRRPIDADYLYEKNCSLDGHYFRFITYKIYVDNENNVIDLEAVEIFKSNKYLAIQNGYSEDEVAQMFCKAADHIKWEQITADHRDAGVCGISKYQYDLAYGLTCNKMAKWYLLIMRQGSGPMQAAFKFKPTEEPDEY